MKKTISGLAFISVCLFFSAADLKTALFMAAITAPLVGLALYLNRKNIF